MTREIYLAVAPTVYTMLLETSEPAIVQSCTELLRTFLQRAGATMLSWGGPTAAADPEAAALDALLRATAHVLNPNLDEMAAMFAGGLLLQMFRSLPTQLAPALPGLLRLLGAKIVAAKVEAIRGQLLAVFARYASPMYLSVHVCARGVYIKRNGRNE